MKQILLLYSAFMLMSVLPVFGQQGYMYRMESAGFCAKTIDGGINESTYHVLRFNADSVALCTYTLTTEQKKEQYLGALAYSDWLYFKWHKKGDRLLIAGLPQAYTSWAELQIQGNKLAVVQNKNVVFERIRPSVAATVSGKAYAAPIGNNSYITFTFDTDSVELSYQKNIASQGAVVLFRDETSQAEKYKWMALGTHLLIPGYGQCLLTDDETGQLQLLYNGKYIFLKQEALYKKPAACTTIEPASEKKQKKHKPGTKTRRYGDEAS